MGNQASLATCLNYRTAAQSSTLTDSLTPNLEVSRQFPWKKIMDKAEADRHDKMLELAELLAEVLQKAVPSLSEQQVEEAGIYMAKNRDVFAKAFKSQPDALSELLNAAAE
ncbi:YebG protein [Pseudomonas poae]|uniref:YebG protein n=3 Tax=Pseudomonas TaxID=286 RepID=A0ABY0RG98_9PSED|nr:YebG protein [Pseudomonas poae]